MPAARGYWAGGEWVHRNPFVPARMSDDEIAVAACLEKTAAYVAGGPEFYGLAEACQDHYLGLVVKQATETRRTVQAEPHPWASL